MVLYHNFPSLSIECWLILRLAMLVDFKIGGNFIEGMACIGGAGCLTHGEKNKAELDKYGREALEKTIGYAISLLK